MYKIIDIHLQYCEPVSPISGLNIEPTTGARGSVPSDATLPPCITPCGTSEEYQRAAAKPQETVPAGAVKES